MESVLAFLPVVALMVLAPGVNNLVVLRGTLVAGPRGGVVATAGTSAGIVVWAAAVAAGLAGVVRSHPEAWAVLQWVGVGVLVVLGMRSLAKAWGRAGEPGPSTATHAPSTGGFVRAFATSVLNPRAGITAVALLPQFVVPGAAPGPTTLLLGLTWASVAAVWNLCGVWLASRGREALARPSARRAVDALGGLAMVAVAVSVGLSV